MTALELEYLDAYTTQRDASREYDEAKRLLAAASNAVGRATTARIRAAVHLAAVTERLRAEGLAIPSMLPKAAA